MLVGSDGGHDKRIRVIECELQKLLALAYGLESRLQEITGDDHPPETNVSETFESGKWKAYLA